MAADLGGPDGERDTRRWIALCVYPEDIEADFQREYGVDLRDLWRPGGGESKMTIRRFGAFLDRLPPESAYHTAAANDAGAEALAEPADQGPARFGAWSHTDHLLATIADRMLLLDDSLYRIQGAANITPRPRIPRPGIPPAESAPKSGGALSTAQRDMIARQNAVMKQNAAIARAKAGTTTEGGGPCPTTPPALPVPSP